MVMIQTLRAPDPAGVERWTVRLKNEPMCWAEAVDCDTFLLALDLANADELEAAHRLGIVPKLTIYDRDAAILPAGYDWFTPADWEARVAKWPGADPEDEDEAPPPRDHYLAGEVADEIFEPGKAHAIEFPQIEILD